MSEKLKAALDKIFKAGDYKQLVKSIQQNVHPANRSKVIAVTVIDKFYFLLKIYAPTAVHCNIDRDDGMPAPAAEAEILKQLFKAVGDVTPCIPVLFGAHEMNAADFKKYHKTLLECMKKDDELCRIWESIALGESKGRPTFIAMELCSIGFSDFCMSIRTHIDVWILKSLLWMMLYTFYRIRQVFPKFSHNDMWGRNIMLHVDSEYAIKDRSTNVHYLQFASDAGKFNIPYYGLIPKIIDFETAVLDDTIKSSVKILGEADDVMKLLLYLNSLFSGRNQISDLVNDIVGFRIPIGTGLQQKAFIESKGGLPSLEKMIKSPVFGYDKVDVADNQVWGSW